MKSKDLKAVPIIELRKLAKQMKVSLKRTMTKTQLIKAIVLSTRSRAISATLKGKKRARTVPQPPQSRGMLHHVRTPLSEEEALPVYTGISKLTILPRDPWWVFVYWEIDRAVSAGRSLVLRVYRQNDRLYASISVGDANNWYINLPEPGDSVRSEIGYLRPGGEFHVLAVSNTVKTPRAWPSNVGFTGVSVNPGGSESGPFLDASAAYENITPSVRENITSRKR